MTCLRIILISLYIFTIADVYLSSTEENENLFEGDLKIPLKLILHHYNFSSIPGGNETLQKYLSYASNTTHGNSIMKRAARSTSHLWGNAIVSYRISARTTTNIRSAIQSLQDNTCLEFIEDYHTNDYIEFTDTKDDCFSSFVGKQGGRQVINLQSPACDSVGGVLHLIAHAIGLWHEQSRPDRDRYITIFWNNIDPSEISHFIRRNDYEVDYQGTGYDYGSLMHSPDTTAKRPGCRGSHCITIGVNNESEYIRQGLPKLGGRNNSLSATDILQINRMYSCHGSGRRGFLAISIKFGIDLVDNNATNQDIYVKITAIDSEGINHISQTPKQHGTIFPVWNEHLLLGNGNWQYFRISAHGNKQLTMSQTVAVQNRNQQNLRNCKNTECMGFVVFDYYLDSRVIRTAELHVRIRYARNLVSNVLRPNPYVSIQANQLNSATRSRSSDSDHDTSNPDWDNESINFGCKQWISMIIQVLESNRDTSMSEKELVQLSRGRHTSLQHLAHGIGFLIYDYTLTVDRNDCSPNPCQNRGTCRDRCNSFTCRCRQGYTGDRCQSARGNLRVTARYARYLPDSDGFLNDSDPYMEFIAIDENGRQVRRTTYYVQGDNSPVWNQELTFGTRVWESLRVRVYDADVSYDDALSRQEMFYLSARSRSRYSVRHNCYSGYAIFDYSY